MAKLPFIHFLVILLLFIQLHSQQIKPSVYVRKNDSLGEYELNEKEFLPITSSYKAYKYVSPVGLSKSEAFKDSRVFPLDLSEQMILDELNLSYSKVLHLDSSSPVFSAFVSLEHAKHNIEYDVAFDDPITFRRAKYFFDRAKVKNSKLYKADLDLLRTYLPYGAYDFVITTPPNTKLGEVYRHPSTLLTLKKSDIKEYSEKQRMHLVEAYKYLKEEGIILYIVKSQLQEETNKVIEDFISHYSDLRLISSRYIAIEDYSSDGLFFAYIAKGN